MAPLPTLAASSLSTPASHAFTEPVPSTSAVVQTPAHLLDDRYDLPATLAHLARMSPPAQNVALQFPDELLGDSVEVFRRVQAGLDRLGHGGRAWVLADTTYGSCCIDSLSALHIGADFLVHYGHACLTPCADPSLLNRIRYVFPKLPLSIPTCANSIAALAESAAGEEVGGRGVLVVHEVGYEWAAAALERDVRERVKGKGREVVFSHIRLEDQDVDADAEGVEKALVGLKVDDTVGAACRNDAPSSSTATKGSCCGGSAPTSTPAADSSCCSSSSTQLAPASCCSSTDTPAATNGACCQSSASTSSSYCSARASPPVPSAAGETSTTSTSLRSYTLPEGAALQDFTIFFLGRDESLQLRNLLVTHSQNTVYSYSPPEEEDATEEQQRAVEPVLQSGKTSRLLMRRYATMQRARDADVFGLLVGNVNLSGSLPLLAHLRKLLKEKHKKAYTVSVGKLNPAKLANFAEVECFVLVACGENTLVDSKEFYRPIITPYELELALQDEPQWGAREYVLDFAKLVPEGDVPTGEQPPVAGQQSADAPPEQDNADNDNDDDDDQPIFSTITGTYRHPKRYGAATTTTASTYSTSLALRNSDSELTHTNLPATSELWKGRTWVGLDPRVGMDRVGVLEEGRGGRAWNYEEEKEARVAQEQAAADS